MPHTPRHIRHPEPGLWLAGFTLIGRAVLHYRRPHLGSLWEALTGLTTMLIGATAGGMLAVGEHGYSADSYRILRLAPGGIRTYGFLLSALFVMMIFAFGQHQAGRSEVMRISLSLAAAWYVAWCIVLICTCVLDGQLYSWSAICGNVFVALVINMLARFVPPDRR